MRRFWPATALIYPILTLMILTQNDYWQNVWFSVMLFTLLAVSWNLLSGFTGYISFGHAAFFAVGGYTAGLLVAWPAWAVLTAAGAVAAIVGLLFAAPSLRIKGLYFAVVTLGMSEILRVVALHWPSLTGGATGMGIRFSGSQTDALLLTCVVTSLVVLTALSLSRTTFGQRLIALRCDEVGAAALGINTSLCKILVLLLSALTTGLAGALYALWLGFLEPSDAFSTHRLIAILAMNIFGGILTPLGPILGALMLGALQELTWVASPFLHQVFFGLAILVFGLWLPKGILGSWQERFAARVAVAARKAAAGL